MMRRGDRLRSLATAIFDAQTLARIIDPAIADLQRDPFSIGQYVAVLKVMVLCLPEVSMRFGIVSMVTLSSMLGVIAFLEAPFALQAWRQGVFDVRMLAYLVPQGVSFALTIGLTVGTLCAFAGRRASRRAEAFLLVLALSASAVSFVNAGWVVPGANQAFREAWAVRVGLRTPPVRNYPEMTFGEVRERLSKAMENPGTLDERDLNYLAVSYQGRLAASIAPLMFTVFALVLLGVGPGRRWVVGLGACAAYLGYLLFLTEPRLVALNGPWLGGSAWYPLVALVVITAAVSAGSFLTHATTTRASA